MKLFLLISGKLLFLPKLKQKFLRNQDSKLLYRLKTMMDTLLKDVYRMMINYDYSFISFINYHILNSKLSYFKLKI